MPEKRMVTVIAEPSQGTTQKLKKLKGYFFSVQPFSLQEGANGQLSIMCLEVHAPLIIYHLAKFGYEGRIQ